MDHPQFPAIIDIWEEIG